MHAQFLRFARLGRPGLVVCAVLLGVYTVGSAPLRSQAAQTTPEAEAARARLLALQREAVALLTRAGRADLGAGEIRRALAEAGQRFDTLAAPTAAPDEDRSGAGTGAASPNRARGNASAATAGGARGDAAATRTAAAVLPPALRTELARAARELAAASSAASDDGSGAAPRLDRRPLLALLERVRTQLDGEVALGLTFQGSYSQSTVKDKEPAYGGHASAMGPPPAPAPPSGAAPGAAGTAGAGVARGAAAGSSPGATAGAAGADPIARSPVTFEEAAHLTARTFCGGPTKDHILESAGNGVALFDYDNDGWLDVYLVTAAALTPARERVPHRNVLYRNLGQWRFEDVSQRAGVDGAAWGSGACVGDVDNDGRLDLYVTNWGPNALYRNRGDGTFEEIAARAGVAAGAWSTGCTFFDADGDDDLDLYVARYVETTWEAVVRAQRTLIWRNGPRIMVGPAGLPGESDLFFENTGGGRFVESAAARGLGDPARAYGFGVVATDYDGDGAVDLFVANDSNPNFLYRNDGTGRFESVGLAAGVAVNDEARAQAGMGVDAGDYDGDGRMDLVLTAFAHDRNSLYHNVDGDQFEDATVKTGLAAPTFVRMGWGAAFLDADLDGWLDLFFANGHIFSDVEQFPQLGETYRQRNQLLLNRAGGADDRGARTAGGARDVRFQDVSAGAGGALQLARVGRGLAMGDLDNDGDLDLVVSNMDETPTVMENRQRTGHHWVGVRVTAPAGNRFAIGARVTIEAGGRTQMREIRSGGSYLSQHDLRTWFGLGTSAGPIAVEVRLGARRWRWPALPADRLHTLELTDAARVPHRKAGEAQ